MSEKSVLVAVGVIVQDSHFFLTKRHVNAHQGGKWEFPGGKVDKGETVAEALHRELQEEIGIDTLSCTPLITISHDYSDKKVSLEVFLVDQYLNEPTAQEGQEQGWFSLAELQTTEFPDANVAIVKRLTELYS